MMKDYVSARERIADPYRKELSRKSNKLAIVGYLLFYAAVILGGLWMLSERAIQLGF